MAMPSSRIPLAEVREHALPATQERRNVMETSRALHVRKRTLSVYIDRKARSKMNLAYKDLLSLLSVCPWLWRALPVWLVRISPTISTGQGHSRAGCVTALSTAIFHGL